jgi:ATP-dependent Zn protease
MTADALFERLRNALYRLMGMSDPGADGKIRPRPAFVTESLAIAIHESGHAVAAWCSTCTKSVDRISIDEPYGGIAQRTEAPGSGPDFHWSRIVIGLAGIAAEGLVIGKIGRGSTVDLSKARKEAEDLVALGPKVACDIPWDAAFADGATLDISRMFHGQMDPVVRGILNVSYRQARRIVRLHHSAFERTVDALMAKRVLQGADLDAVLDPDFGFLCKRMRPIFVLPVQRAGKGDSR